MLSAFKNRAILYVVVSILSVFIANIEPYFSIENINDYIEKKLYEQQRASDIYENVTAGMKKDNRGLISFEDADAIMKSDLSEEEKNAFALEVNCKINNLKPVDKIFLKSIYKDKITNKQNQNFEIAKLAILLIIAIALLDGVLTWLNAIKMTSITYAKSTAILLESVCLVWFLIALILFRRNFEPLIVFGFIPIILANGWFFFKYFKNNER